MFLKSLERNFRFLYDWIDFKINAISFNMKIHIHGQRTDKIITREVNNQWRQYEHVP